MAKNLNDIDQIEKYLEDQLSGTEKLDFERKLQQDPLLKNEFDWQKDMVESIKQFRKSELKSRLNAIKVGPSPYVHILKIAASVTTASLLTIGAYNYFSNSDNVSPINLTESHVISFDQNELPQKPEAPQELKNEIGLSEVAANEDQELYASNKTKTEISSKAALTRPQFVMPEIIEEFEDDEPALNEVDISSLKNEFSSLSNNTLERVEITSINHNTYDFHYQFFNGKLFLYGEFDQMPYEILELNTENNRKLYLFYNDHYYSLKDDQSEIVPLNQIQDSLLIKELHILKSSKSK
ncbi:MAG: hypothetical protein ACNS62_05205 [Candidatus Cyclobacteriaceae bacterium M3_2C_046]